MLDFFVKTRTRFSVRDKRLFDITEVKIIRVDYISLFLTVRCMFSADVHRPWLTSRVHERNDYINAVFLPVSSDTLLSCPLVISIYFISLGLKSILGTNRQLVATY